LTIRGMSPVCTTTSRRILTCTSPFSRGSTEPLVSTYRPTHLVLLPGRSAAFRLTVRVPFAPRERVATGVVAITPDGGATLRVPWAIGFRHYAGTLLARVRLQKGEFKPSDVSPTVLEIQAGR